VLWEYNDFPEWRRFVKYSAINGAVLGIRTVIANCIEDIKR